MLPRAILRPKPYKSSPTSCNTPSRTICRRFECGFFRAKAEDIHNLVCFPYPQCVHVQYCLRFNRVLANVQVSGVPRNIHKAFHTLLQAEQVYTFAYAMGAVCALPSDLEARITKSQLSLCPPVYWPCLWSSLLSTSVQSGTLSFNSIYSPFV